MQEAEPLAYVKDLVKTYRTESAHVEALRGVNAEIAAASVTAVIGPSGSGKSTLLRLLAGLDTASTGTVVVDGHVLTDVAPAALRRIRQDLVGYVFQRPGDNFIAHLTVAEHLELMAKRADGKSRLSHADLLQHLGIAGRSQHYPHQLSGGEQQRAAFASVLSSSPRLVVADEPTAELDSASGHALLELIADLRSLGVSFVIATHDSKVAEMADHRIHIDHGLVTDQTGKPHASQRRKLDVQRGNALYQPQHATQRATQHTERPRRATPIVTVDEISKRYRRGSEEVHALDRVSVELQPATVTALVGPSGSGKTTLLSLLAGWEEPDAGQIRWDRGSHGILGWREVAILPQKHGLLEELTIRENVAYPARLDRSTANEVQRVDDLLDELGLTELADRHPSQTSTGQQQRAALARGLLLRPRLLLADEPSGHQDKGWAEGVFCALRAAANSGTCCLVATHNEELAARCDEVISMRDGAVRSVSAGL